MGHGQYRALDNVHSGNGPVVKPGEIVPATFIDSLGETQPVDFDRLVELGAVQDASLPYTPDGAADEAVAPAGAPPVAEPTAPAKAKRPAKAKAAAATPPVKKPARPAGK
jgi:hypothetical protein